MIMVMKDGDEKKKYKNVKKHINVLSCVGMSISLKPYNTDLSTASSRCL